MLKKSLLLLCFWGIMLFLEARELGVVYDLEYAHWLDYNPQIVDKEYLYSHILDIKAGFTLVQTNGDSIWCIAGVYNDNYDKNLRLEKSGYQLQYKRSDIGFEYERDGGIGNNSEIYQEQLANKYNREGYLLPYSSSCVFWQFRNKQLRYKVKLGSNNFNEFLMSYDLFWKKLKDIHQLNILIMSRDNYYNQKLLSLNYQGSFARKYLRINSGLSLQCLGEIDKRNEERFISLYFGELIVPIAEWVDSGINSRFKFDKQYRKERNCNIYLKIHNSSHSIALLYEQEDWDIEYSLKAWNIIYWWQLQKNFRVGLLCKKLYPSIGDECYEAGIQVTISQCK